MWRNVIIDYAARACGDQDTCVPSLRPVSRSVIVKTWHRHLTELLPPFQGFHRTFQVSMLSVVPFFPFQADPSRLLFPLVALPNTYELVSNGDLIETVISIG